ncbi:MAG: protein kinase [Acidobacteria bacterium]|nr:protein kinase [Acidobacteriota bacterium]
METKKISGQEGGRKTQVVTPFGTAPIPAAPSLKQTGFDGMLLKDRYLIEGELGRGGIGVVYLARDTQLMNRRVVVKVLLEDSANALHNPWFKKKFEQEIEALVRLDHPGIVGVLDVGTMPDGKEFFVMQYVEGGPLRKLVNGQMEFAQVARIVRQIGQALSAAHDKGIVHRDLKPENIMVQQVGDDEELIKLIDFGIASVKDSQVATSAEKTKVAGALPYMAPEQLRGQPDASSDIWALGAMAYEMLTGRLPFYAETLVQLYELQKRGVQASPRSLRPEISHTVEGILLKSMAFDPAERYQRAKDLGEELARALAGEEKVPTGAQSSEHVSSAGITTPPPHATSESPGYGTVMTHSARTEVSQGVSTPPTVESKPKSKLPIFAVAAVIVLALALWGWKSWQKVPPPSPLPEASRQLDYSLLVRTAKSDTKEPIPLPGEIIFTPGDQLRMIISSQESGYFYIVNEGPKPKNGLPAYNFLFPDPAQVPDATTSLKAGKSLFIPSDRPDGWLTIDTEQGTETLWFVWSDKSIPELEAAKKWLTPQYGGEVQSATEIAAIQQFLNKHSANKPVATKDDTHTNLKGGKDGILVYPVKLQHT